MAIGPFRDLAGGPAAGAVAVVASGGLKCEMSANVFGFAAFISRSGFGLLG